MGLELDDLRRQNELINEQLEATRLNSEEIREQISLSKQLSQLAQVSRDAALRINRTNRELSDINKDVIDKLKERNNLSRKLSEIEKDLTKSQKIHSSLETEINELLDKQGKIRGRNSIANKKSLQNIIDGLREQQANNNEINKSLEREYTLVEQINSRLGLAPALAEGLGKALDKIGFGNLSKQLKLEEVVQNTRNWVVENEGNVTSFGILAKFSGGVLKNIGGMLSSMNILQGSIVMLIKAMGDVDNMAGQTAKQFGVSYDEALKINGALTEISANSKNIFATTKNLVEAQNQLNVVLGTNREINGDSLLSYTELTKQAGYSVESAQTLFKLRQITGKSEKDIISTYLGQVKALNLQNKLSINEKSLLNDISNTSKNILATYSQNPKELAKAAFEAKKLGISMKEIEGIQSSLLDIESSINAEFEAEVLTGKQLNLERARYYALTNDISGLAKEIGNQGIDLAKWGEINNIQQEAIAKSMGMSKDQMAGMLLESSALSKLGMDDNEENRKKLQYLKEHGGSLESINKLGQEEYERQRKSVTTQETFTQSMDKLKEIAISIVTPFMSVLSVLSEYGGLITGIVSSFTALKVIQLTSLGIQQASVAASAMQQAFAFTALSTEGSRNTLIAARQALLSGELAKTIGIAAAWAIANPFQALLGLGLAAGVGALVYSQMKDGVIDPKKGPVVSGEFGSVQLHKDDQIVAGTNLFPDKQPTNKTIQSNDGGITVLSSTLGNKMDQMIGKLDTLIYTMKNGMVINLDGNRVSQELGTPMAITTRNI